MKRAFRLLLILFSINVFGQNLDLGFQLEESKSLKKPISFSHVPFLLLKINPSNVFGINNHLAYGIELAPPFGKFSFAFDYGVGKGSWNPNRFLRSSSLENKNTVYRGEVRMYFSDWFPFYALDKKPFGRYYAIEYVQSKFERNMEMASGVGGNQLPSFAQFRKVNFTENNQAINLKIGKHIHLSRFLFLDVFAGIGIAKFEVAENDGIATNSSTIPLHFSFLSNKKIREPNTNGLYFNTVSGIRLALPL
jgi:hypothetical protein